MAAVNSALATSLATSAGNVLTVIAGLTFPDSGRVTGQSEVSGMAICVYEFIAGGGGGGGGLESLGRSGEHRSEGQELPRGDANRGRRRPCLANEGIDRGLPRRRSQWQRQWTPSDLVLLALLIPSL